VSAIKWNKNLALITNKNYTKTKKIGRRNKSGLHKRNKKIRVHTITEGTKV
jgi:hypothetical protein